MNTTLENPANETQASEEKLLYGVAEAARKLSCSPGLIRKLIRQRKLPRIQGVRKILVPVSALQNFVKEFAGTV